MPGIRPQPAKLLDDPEQFFLTLWPKIPDMVRWAFRRRGYWADRAEIEDLSQEIGVRLIQKQYHRLRSFAQQSSPETWLEKIVWRFVSNYLRRRKSLHRLDELSLAAFIYYPPQEMKILTQERAAALRAAISQLTPREQQLLKLRYEDGLSMEAVAKEMGIKVTSARQRSHEIFNKLRAILNCTGSAGDRLKEKRAD